MAFIPVVFSFYGEVIAHLPVEILANPTMLVFIRISCQDRTKRDKMVNCFKLILAESISFVCSDIRSNHRPISVLPVISKLFEKLVNDQYYNFLFSNHLLCSHQSSFRRLHTVLTCLLKCTNDWYLNTENGKYTSVTFINFKKAFDTVNHEILVKKLQIYGIRGKELLWFKSYLSQRKQCCKVNGKLSDLGEVTCGVPQGSWLGPLLSIIYINDPPLSIKHS